MNKKLISTTLALSLCAIAIVPIYNNINLNTNKNDFAVSEWDQANSEKLFIKKQLLTTDDKVTVAQSKEKPVDSTEIKTNTENKTVAKEATNNKNSVTKKVTANKESSNKKTSKTANKAVTSSTKSKTSTSTKSAIKTTAKKSTSSKTASSSSKTTTAAKTTSSAASKTTTKSTTTNRGTASTAVSSKASALISTAKSLMGIPYVWGGTTTSGFDCSGFTKYVFGKNGIALPRTAAEQYNVGTSVSKSNLRAGDLVFFTTYKAGASHLGIYLGDGTFIHSSSSKGVTITSLSNSYYSSRYIGARRVIK